jgi:hypothetical protein
MFTAPSVFYLEIPEHKLMLCNIAINYLKHRNWLNSLWWTVVQRSRKTAHFIILLYAYAIFWAGGWSLLAILSSTQRIDVTGITAINQV